MSTNLLNLSNPDAATNALDKLIAWNDKLLGLPALPFLVVGCIAFGYFIKGVPFIHDKWVPFSCHAFGILGYMALGCITMNFSAPWMIVFATLFKNGVIGMIASVSSRMIYRSVIKPLERRLGMSDSDPAAFDKSKMKPEDLKP